MLGAASPNATGAQQPNVIEADLLSFIEWDPERFGIGVKSIDEQHKILITLTNGLTKVYIAAAYPKLSVSMDTLGVASPMNTSNVNAASLISNTNRAPSSRGVMKSAVIQAKALAAIREADAETSLLLDPVLGHKEFPVVGFRQFDPLLQAASNVELNKVVEDLVTYTCKFLLAEDHMLETYAYPDRALQQQDHELFVNEVSFLFKLVEENNAQLSDIRRMLVFLRLWLSGHIPRDRKYAPMLIEKGVGS
ncbi:hemerythrin-like metal-binding protein, putative [Bodo saltans]|uniref:Hemerythrin-like metal-binding protein, putative n=1 Tax=Bodo saltans TaxID=75058 RepID=A0A0S4JHD1_BODSA|nr:hemerythrin-like metal-binding protein, putative [Bodo saltans]|eukprot:CUG90929.1 hemerythrin-like metal-binding protein, putative [Bodo saltans]